MFRNSLITNRTESPNPQQTQMLKPGDYELGSLESRAAARALLEAKLSGNQQDRFRVVVRVIGRRCHLESCTCYRSLWDDGTVFEFVQLDGTDDEFTAAKLDELVRKVPIDGKKYTLAELGAG